jgi:hypothetical protein
MPEITDALRVACFTGIRTIERLQPELYRAHAIDREPCEPGSPAARLVAEIDTLHDVAASPHTDDLIVAAAIDAAIAVLDRLQIAHPPG